MTANFKDAEENMLRTFANNVSVESRDRLPPDEPMMPFANLRDGDWRRRNHGIARATIAAAGTTAAKPAMKPLPSEPPSAGQTATALPTSTPQHRSQKVSSNDIAAGQVRIPRGVTKTALPSERSDITVVLRGRELGACRWDPRYGPPERSGVIRIGRSTARELLAAGEVLVVTAAPDDVVGLD